MHTWLRLSSIRGVCPSAPSLFKEPNHRCIRFLTVLLLDTNVGVESIKTGPFSPREMPEDHSRPSVAHFLHDSCGASDVAACEWMGFKTPRGTDSSHRSVHDSAPE